METCFLGSHGFTAWLSPLVSGCSCCPARPRAHQGQPGTFCPSTRASGVSEIVFLPWYISFAQVSLVWVKDLSLVTHGPSTKTFITHLDVQGYLSTHRQALTSSPLSSPPCRVKCPLTHNTLGNDVYYPTMKILLFMVTIRMSSNMNAHIQWGPFNWLFM